jgi:hypothetical protein
MRLLLIALKGHSSNKMKSDHIELWKEGGMNARE